MRWGLLRLAKRSAGVLFEGLLLVACAAALAGTVTLSGRSVAAYLDSRALAAVGESSVQDSDVLARWLFTAPTEESAVVAKAFETRTGLALVVDQECEDCTSAAKAWTGLMEAAAARSLPVLAVIVAPGTTQNLEAQALGIPAVAQTLVTSSPEMFRAVTGIVGVPTLIFVSQGTVEVVATGVPSMETILAARSRVMDDHVGGLLVRNDPGGKLLLSGPDGSAAAQDRQ